ncbi:MAG TPA: LpqB family beta-propeller domain-containing protein, partial [Gemmatimonadaceae bacterium]|nr:LpqB family beta-propeller domain-containing protein [Gemmatimonadaceae bacterium]
MRFVVTPADSVRPVDNYPWPAAISPDGSTIVYTAGAGSTRMLYSLRTDQLDPRPIPGTEGAWEPFFSPDGEWVAFESPGKTKKVRLDGSAPITVTSANAANGSDWTTGEELVFGAEASKKGLLRVSASGGDLVEFVKPNPSKGETDYLWPIGLPDGKRVVFTVWTGTLASATLATVSLDGGDVSYLGIKGIRPLAVVNGKLVYVQADGAVMAVALDGSGRRTEGRPIPVHDPVRVIAGNNGNSGIFVSPGGALLVSRGGTQGQMSWITSDGKVTPITKEARSFGNPRISPDGKRIAIVVGDQDKSDIWTYDLGTETFSRLSSNAAARSPSWSPDGSKIYYVGLGDKERFAIWSQAPDGGSPAEKIVDVRGLAQGVDVAPDGKSLLITSYNGSWDLSRFELGRSRVPISYVATPAEETSASFSPDGNWVAYDANESGRGETYVRSYPNPSSRVQISAGGGAEPSWDAAGNRV